MGAIYFVIAILAILLFLGLEWVLDNILWIGIIIIAVLVFTTIKNIKYYKEFGFDFAEFVLVLLKVGIIAFIVYLMCL